MARVWGVQDADEKLSGWISEDETDTAPVGETAVLESAIRAFDPPGAEGRIQSGGHFNATTGYTPPVGDELFLPYDPTTADGMVKDAAHNMMNVFDDAVAFILRNRTVWPQFAVVWAISGIHWQTVNAARMGLNSVRTTTFRQKFFEEAASWPTGLSGDVSQYVDSFIDPPNITEEPNEKFSWVEDDTDPPGRVVTMSAYSQFDTTINVEDAPTTAKLLGRAWIDDVPA